VIPKQESRAVLQKPRDDATIQTFCAGLQKTVLYFETECLQNHVPMGNFLFTCSNTFAVDMYRLLTASQTYGQIGNVRNGIMPIAVADACSTIG